MDPTTLTAISLAISILALATTALNAYSYYQRKAELAEFQNSFLERLNGRYLSVKVAELQFEHIDERLNRLETTQL